MRVIAQGSLIANHAANFLLYWGLHSHGDFCKAILPVNRGGEAMSRLPTGAVPEQNPLSATTVAILGLVQGLLPAMTAIVGGLWVVTTYLEQKKQDDLARIIEARRPFIGEQLARYMETAKIAGLLVSSNQVPRSKDWSDAVRRFEELYWTELSLVEDDGVKGRMEEFAALMRTINRLDAAKVPDTDWEELRQRSYRLARALHDSIEKSWKLTN